MVLSSLAGTGWESARTSRIRNASKTLNQRLVHIFVHIFVYIYIYYRLVRIFVQIYMAVSILPRRKILSKENTTEHFMYMGLEFGQQPAQADHIYIYICFLFYVYIYIYICIYTYIYIYTYVFSLLLSVSLVCMSLAFCFMHSWYVSRCCFLLSTTITRFS